MDTFIENQNWRYATKKFDSSKKISTEDLNILKEAIRLTASSYGLQPYKIFLIENKDIREQLKEFSWRQSQVTDASHLFVFANYVDIQDSYIDNYIDNIAKTRNLKVEDLKGFADLMKTKIIGLSPNTKAIWTSKQAYLAMGNLLNVAAELKIDATPMEGFEPSKYNEILGLDKLGLNASLVVPVGYRHEEDYSQHYIKVRKSKEELFETI